MNAIIEEELIKLGKGVAVIVVSGTIIMMLVVVSVGVENSDL